MRLLSNLFKNFDVTVEDSFYLHDKTRNEKVININNDNHKSDENGTSVSNSYDYLGHKNAALIEQANEEAEKIIEQAKENAQKIRASALEKIKLEYESSKKRGYEDGINQGKAEAIEQNQETVNELINLIHAIDSQKGLILNSYEAEIKELAITIVNKLINVELEKDNDAFVSIYKSAVKDAINQEWIKLSVSDLQYEFATVNAETLKSMVKGAKYIEIIKIKNAPKGTCIVETPHGIVNASIDIQIDKIRDAFMKAELAI